MSRGNSVYYANQCSNLGVFFVRHVLRIQLAVYTLVLEGSGGRERVVAHHVCNKQGPGVQLFGGRPQLCSIYPVLVFSARKAFAVSGYQFLHGTAKWATLKKK